MSNQDIIEAIIKKYESKKGFRPTPVRNFLGSLGGQSTRDASMNLAADARCYAWKPCIVNAIKEGIMKLTKGANCN